MAATKSTNVIALPNAALEPIVQNRRRSSYGRKLVSFNSARSRRDAAAKREAQEAAQAEEEKAKLQRRRMDAMLYFKLATREIPLKVAGHIEMLTVEEQAELLLQHTCELQWLAAAVMQRAKRRPE